MTDVPLAEGQAALAAGDWASARAAFEAAGDSAEALAGLGTALMWLGETDAAVHAREQAYAAFCRRPDPLQAAITALSLYFLFRSSLGNVAASRGWLGRAARLADELRLPLLTGWVVLARAHDSDDPQAAERFAREACEAARATSDRDLDLCALSQLGIALVDLGRVEEGAALLDEAMAASLGGEGEQLQTVVYTSCNMIMACSRAAQFDRATQWIRAAGPFTRRYGSPHVYVLCRLHHGKVLLSTGDWAAAEAELDEALQGSRATEPSLTAETLAALAELRLAQNRVEDAAALVANVADHPAATPAVAAVHLARAEPAAAEAILRRRLRAIGDDRLASGPLLELLALVELQAGRRAEAEATAGRLAALAARSGCAALVARADLVLGAVTGDVAALERALERFAALEMPFEAARTHLLLARALDGDAAVAAARSALAGFEALGAARGADEAAAFLRSLGRRAARAGPRGGHGTLTKREREVLALLGEGLTNRAIADRLFVSQKTAQHHVAAVLFKLDLANRAQAAAYAVRELHEREHARRAAGPVDELERRDDDHRARRRQLGQVGELGDPVLARARAGSCGPGTAGRSSAPCRRRCRRSRRRSRRSARSSASQRAHSASGPGVWPPLRNASWSWARASQPVRSSSQPPSGRAPCSASKARTSSSGEQVVGVLRRLGGLVDHRPRGRRAGRAGRSRRPRRRGR